MKKYEVTGCHWYLTNFTFTIEAKNKIEAMLLAREEAKSHEDPAIAEMVELIIDSVTEE